VIYNIEGSGGAVGSIRDSSTVDGIRSKTELRTVFEVTEQGPRW
jgi:hypothetical protein